jgi:O-methyltransferase domain protein
MMKLDKIPETMLITLWAKAEEHHYNPHFLVDKKAEEMLPLIDYDFSKFSRSKFSQAGVCLRASLIDKETQTFLSIHPDAVVIQLGAGLDARYERLGCPEVTHWYELDLPEVIQLRKDFFQENDNRSFIALSLFDMEWVEQIKAHNKPILILIEGVLMYFDPEEVKAFFLSLCQRLPKATVLFDMLAYSLVGHAKNHDSLSTMDKKQRPEFKWSERDSHTLEQWHPALHVEREYFMSDYNQGRYPFIFRMLYKIPYFYRRFNQRVVNLTIG